MYCRNCGNSLENGVSFCKYCGTKVILEEEINNDDSVFLRYEMLDNNVDESVENEEIQTNDGELEKVKVKNEISNEILKEDVKESKQIIKNEVFEKENREESTKNSEFSIYEKRLIFLKNNEIKINRISDVILLIVGGLIVFYYYGLDEEYGFLVSLLSGSLITSILWIPVGAVFNRIKKEKNCYKAIEKYEKYQELKYTMSEENVINVLELEFSQLNSTNKHGVLYYLICILLVVIILGIC